MKAHLVSLVLLAFASLAIGKESLQEQPFSAEEDELDESSCWAGDFCQWWSDTPGRVYREKKNPWISRVEVSGRFHYQFGRVEGNDVRGNHFGNSFDEFRRARVTAKVDFLKYFDLEVGTNLVDDQRFRADPTRSLDWGHDTFDTITLGFDVGKALGKGPFDEIKLTYGRMKVRIGDEIHTSSNKLKTIERSALSDQVGTAESRPTGVTLELEKGDWTAVIGAFSNEADGHTIANWDNGLFYYGSLEWDLNQEWTLRLDHVHADQDSANTALGIRHGTAFSIDYDSKRWGMTTDLVYGKNGNDEFRNPLREGDFYGVNFTPWVWLVKDHLQLVGRYQYARAEETEGFRLRNRYTRGQHFPPAIDLDGGFGDENHSFYLGLNWLLCNESIRLMSGISHDLMNARTGDVSSTTYLFAIRTSF